MTHRRSTGVSFAGRPAITVQLWWLHLRAPGGNIADRAALLSSTERDRADAFLFSADRDRYVRVRAAVRTVLADQLNCHPAEVPLRLDSRGRPTVPGRTLDVNVSHSRDVAVIALTRGARVGVDIADQRRTVDWERLARRCYSVAEQQALRRRPFAGDFARAVLRVWAAKEAWLKCTGVGLSQPLDSFVTTVDPGTGRGVVVDPAGHPSRGSLQVLDVGADGILAVAVPGRRRILLTHTVIIDRFEDRRSSGGRVVGGAEQRFGHQPREIILVPDEEVPAAHESDLGIGHRQLPPGLHGVRPQRRVRSARHDTDRAAQRRSRSEPIVRQPGQVRPDSGQVRDGEVGVGQHRGRGAPIPVQDREEFSIGQSGVPGIDPQVRRLHPGDHQLGGTGTDRERPGGLVGHDRTETVSVQAQRLPGRPGQPVGGLAGESEYIEAFGRIGLIGRTDHNIHATRQGGRPPQQAAGVTSGVGKAHQLDGRTGGVVRHEPGQSGIFGDAAERSQQRVDRTHRIEGVRS